MGMSWWKGYYIYIYIKCLGGGGVDVGDDMGKHIGE